MNKEKGWISSPFILLSAALFICGSVVVLVLSFMSVAYVSCLALVSVIAILGLIVKLSHYVL